MTRVQSKERKKRENKIRHIRQTKEGVWNKSEEISMTSGRGVCVPNHPLAPGEEPRTWVCCVTRDARRSRQCNCNVETSPGSKFAYSTCVLFPVAGGPCTSYLDPAASRGLEDPIHTPYLPPSANPAAD
jgi:hypothetical protein